MHPLLNPHAAVPVVTTASALMLAVAVAVRTRSHPARPQIMLLLLLAAIWSLCEAGIALSNTRGLALAFARWSGFGSMFIAPAALQAMIAFEPRLAARAGPLVVGSYVASALAVAVSLASPWVVVDVARVQHGSHAIWIPELGWALPFVYTAVVAGPVGGALMWLRLAQRERKQWRTSRRHGPWVELAFVTPLLVGSLTDFLLPMAGVDAPRLGATFFVAWWGLLWWSIVQKGDERLSPRNFASEILEALPDGVLLLRLDQRIRSANSAMGELIGLPARELLGRPVSELIARPDGAEGASDGDLAWQLALASGDRAPVSIARSNLHDANLEPIGSVLVVRDLREVVSLRNRLLSSGRLAAIGQLAAGIAHEINNPIAYVRSNLSLLRQHWREIQEQLGKTDRGPALAETFDEGDELISETFEGVDRVAGIVRDVEGFSHPSSSAPDVADLCPLLDTAIRMTRPTLRGSAWISNDYREAPLVQCRSQELIQVFLNLLRNAAQAIGERGTIQIVVDRDDIGPFVAIEDDGPGIDPEALERIFEPFFTTKPVGIGTGLGLAISRQIVERHGGAIDVESTPDVGTRFEVRLIAAEGDSGETADAGAEDAP